MKLFTDHNPGERDISVDDFLKILVHDGAPYGPLDKKSGEMIEWSNVHEGGADISIFWQNGLYEMSHAEFNEVKARMAELGYNIEWKNVDDTVYAESASEALVKAALAEASKR